MNNSYLIIFFSISCSTCQSATWPPLRSSCDYDVMADWLFIDGSFAHDSFAYVKSIQFNLMILRLLIHCNYFNVSCIGNAPASAFDGHVTVLPIFLQFDSLQRCQFVNNRNNCCHFELNWIEIRFWN